MATTKGIFGVTMTADGQASAGYLKKVDITNKVKRASIPNEEGNTTDFATYDETVEASVEFWTKDGGNTPDLGNTYDVDGASYSLDEAGKSQEIGGFQSHHVKGIRYVNNNLPA